MVARARKPKGSRRRNTIGMYDSDDSKAEGLREAEHNSAGHVVATRFVIGDNNGGEAAGCGADDYIIEGEGELGFEVGGEAKQQHGDKGSEGGGLRKVEHSWGAQQQRLEGWRSGRPSITGMYDGDNSMAGGLREVEHNSARYVAPARSIVGGSDGREVAGCVASGCIVEGELGCEVGDKGNIGRTARQRKWRRGRRLHEKGGVVETCAEGDDNDGIYIGSDGGGNNLHRRRWRQWDLCRKHRQRLDLHRRSAGGRMRSDPSWVEVAREARPEVVQSICELDNGGMSTLIASICWSNLGHKTDEDSETNIRVYQRPTSNDVYELRATKKPSFCQENENQDAAWYTPIKPCLHKVAAAIEERGTDWPEEWPKRLDTFPEWLADSHDKLTADHKHWKAVVDKSYLGGLGIDWSTIRNVMDMKSIYGGFAAALASQKVWVMNVVPVHAPNTLPIIFERGLLGIYHDWCEPFSTYPRSYDLLHADHLFSRLKNRCKQPVVIVVEMDRILRPGGWVIIRDKLEILDPLEAILRSLYWDIRTTYGKDKEGLICAQKTTWRP
ncbi:hypothetical protein ZIOFF_035009 [Zingiber officinale]|uniref:Methyltransferase n=1 Tax=Zingiber officinale TaxID=94328 RepID=A0A8J5GJK4_ZINOF|nr:hypothetical protein ZIOFF_035009 [Zingiber officinale]